MFFFSFTKRFWAYKNANQPKPTKTNKNERTKHNKGNSFLHAQKLLRGWKLFVLSFGAFLRTKPSCKKNKQLWNCPNNLILLYYWVKNLLVIFAGIFAGFEQVKTPFGETPWLLGRHAVSEIPLRSRFSAEFHFKWTFYGLSLVSAGWSANEECGSCVIRTLQE